VFTTSAQNATILDFNDIGDDTVDVSSFNTTLAEIQSNAVDDGSGNVVIELTDLGGAGNLTLHDTALASLDFTTNHDFIIA